MSKYIIGRFIEGITLNPKEYVWEEDGSNIKIFPTKKEAKLFLLEYGYKNKDIGESVFIEDGEEVGWNFLIHNPIKN